MDRIAGLREILTMDPGNSFARYGLAMELVNAGAIDEALATFGELKESDREYVAGLFMAAQTLASAGRTEEAIARLKHGIESAKAAGNHHALSEMQAMLDDLER